MAVNYLTFSVLPSANKFSNKEQISGLFLIKDGWLDGERAVGCPLWIIDDGVSILKPD